uniref:Uncharacterized protein n=1 Tax=Mimivirus LCMiAC01 TaxID=2506608 RepID=A0A481Z192_9VIRU|nr:MAG: uncharacterized protein LCMiAC01_05390 [Mimivirus LCMiAC01]
MPQKKEDTDNEKVEEFQDNEEESQVPKEFKDHVIQFTKLHKIIKDKQKEIRELKAKSKIHEDGIIKHLDKEGVNIIDITDGKLIKNKSKTKLPLSTDIIENAIREKVKDETKVQEIMKLMKTMRPKKERKYLKRTFSRKKKIKKIIIDAKKKS